MDNWCNRERIDIRFQDRLASHPATLLLDTLPSYLSPRLFSQPGRLHRVRRRRRQPGLLD